MSAQMLAAASKDVLATGNDDWCLCLDCVM